MANKIVREIIHAKGIDIGIYTKDFENEYISLTDIAKYRNDNDPRFVIQNWMRSAPRPPQAFHFCPSCCYNPRQGQDRSDVRPQRY